MNKIALSLGKIKVAYLKFTISNNIDMMHRCAKEKDKLEHEINLLIKKRRALEDDLEKTLTEIYMN